MPLLPSTLPFLILRCSSFSDLLGAVICDVHLVSSELGCPICIILLNDLVLEVRLKNTTPVIYWAFAMRFCFGVQLFNILTDPAFRINHRRFCLPLRPARSQEVHAAQLLSHSRWARRSYSSAHTISMSTSLLCSWLARQSFRSKSFRLALRIPTTHLLLCSHSSNIPSRGFHSLIRCPSLLTFLLRIT